MLAARALDGIPEVARDEDLAELIVAALPADEQLDDGAIVAIAHKAVSKAEGQVRRLDSVVPGAGAIGLATAHDKDPRHVQTVLDETRALLRAENGILICETRHGFICANAGVDASNTAEPDTLVLLPADPDASARRLRARLRELTGAAPAVVITDSFGRTWRHGQTDVAIGAAGLAVLDDWRGRTDSVGRPLSATWIAVADEVAAAADLVRGKDTRQPVVVVRGLEHHITADDGPGVAALLRLAQDDLFR